MKHTESYLVFVYGTLRKEERNHHMLAESELVLDRCWIDGILVDTGHGYPAVIKYLGTSSSNMIARRDCREELKQEHKRKQKQSLKQEQELVKSSGTFDSRRVYGEVYRVTDEVLAELDALEDYFGPGDPRNLYDRVVETIFHESGTVEAFVYIWASECGEIARYPVIQSGDWKNRA